jgi:flavin-binding protein dodecin
LDWGLKKEVVMSDHVYKVIEIVGSSPESSDAAIRAAITRASQSLDEIGWFEVMETRGHVEDGAVAHFQVTLRVGFTLRDTKDPSASQ